MGRIKIEKACCNDHWSCPAGSIGRDRFELLVPDNLEAKAVVGWRRHLIVSTLRCVCSATGHSAVISTDHHIRGWRASCSREATSVVLVNRSSLADRYFLVSLDATGCKLYPLLTDQMSGDKSPTFCTRWTGDAVSAAGGPASASELNTRPDGKATGSGES